VSFGEAELDKLIAQEEILSDSNSGGFRRSPAATTNSNVFVYELPRKKEVISEAVTL